MSKAAPLQHLFVASLARGRLDPGGAVRCVTCIDGSQWWLAFPGPPTDSLSALAGSPPTVEQLQAFAKAEKVEAYSDAHGGWIDVGPVSPPRCRVALGPDRWLVCFNVETPPPWLQGLRDSADPDVLSRMFAAASLSLTAAELLDGRRASTASLKGTGPSPSHAATIVRRAGTGSRDARAAFADAGGWSTVAIVAGFTFFLGALIWFVMRRYDPLAELEDPATLPVQRSVHSPRPPARPEAACDALEQAARPQLTRFCRQLAAKAVAPPKASPDELPAAYARHVVQNYAGPELAKRTNRLTRSPSDEDALAGAVSANREWRALWDGSPPDSRGVAAEVLATIGTPAPKAARSGGGRR
jgi:hypothetical protein